MTLIPHIRQRDCNVISSLRIKKGLSSGSWLYGHPLLVISYTRAKTGSLCFSPDVVHSDW